jgi:hypothetical protein
MTTRLAYKTSGVLNLAHKMKGGCYFISLAFWKMSFGNCV